MQCLERLRRAEPEDVLVKLSLAELLSARAANDQPALRRILSLTQGVENETELHAGLMLYRGRALRGLGLLEAARDCLSAGLRRRKSRPDALLRALRYETRAGLRGFGATRQGARRVRQTVRRGRGLRGCRRAFGFLGVTFHQVALRIQAGRVGIIMPRDLATAF